MSNYLKLRSIDENIEDIEITNESIADASALNLAQNSAINTNTSNIDSNHAAALTELQSIVSNTASTSAPEAGFGFHVRNGAFDTGGNTLEGFALSGYLEDLNATLTTIFPEADLGGTGDNFFVNAGAAQEFFVVGFNAVDTLAGTGAQKVTIEGTGSTGQAQTLVVDMAGVAAVGTGATLFQNINKAFVSQVGSGGSNVARILISGTNAAVFEIQIVIPVGGNMGFSSTYHVPTNFKLFPTTFNVSTSVAGTTQEIRLEVHRILNGIDFKTGHVIIAAAGEFDFCLEGVLPFVSGEIVYLTAIRILGTGDLKVDLIIQGYLQFTAP